MTCARLIGHAFCPAASSFLHNQGPRARSRLLIALSARLSVGAGKNGPFTSLLCANQPTRKKDLPKFHLFVELFMANLSAATPFFAASQSILVEFSRYCQRKKLLFRISSNS